MRQALVVDPDQLAGQVPEDAHLSIVRHRRAQFAVAREADVVHDQLVLHELEQVGLEFRLKADAVLVRELVLVLRRRPVLDEALRIDRDHRRVDRIVLDRRDRRHVQIVEHLQRRRFADRIVDEDSRRLRVRDGDRLDRIAVAVDPDALAGHELQLDHVDHVEVDHIEHLDRLVQRGGGEQFVGTVARDVDQFVAMRLVVLDELDADRLLFPELDRSIDASWSSNLGKKCSVS